MTQYHSNEKKNTDKTTATEYIQQVESNLTPLSADELIEFKNRLEASKKADALRISAERKEKAAKLGRLVGMGLVKTTVVATKVAKTVWVGSFELLKTSVTLVENAPSKITATVLQSVSEQYKKA